MGGLGKDDRLIVSVSGIRGVVGQSLTPEVAMRFAACFGSTLNCGKVVLSRDGRSTGPMLADACSAGLRAVGCDVLNLGVAATPTCGFAVKSFGAAGGIQVTASHNPPEYNGLKLFRPAGFVLSPDAGRQIGERYLRNEMAYLAYDRIGAMETVVDPEGPHLARVLSLVDVDRIRRRRFRVLLDCNHGAGAAFAPRLLDALGCEIEVLGGKPDGRFDHPPEPTAENLAAVCHLAAKAGCDLGFAVDPDADRLAIIDENGRYIGEECSLALAILERTALERGPVVMNLSTSLLSETIARSRGCEVFRTAVGEVHVGEKMITVNAIVGGEGNGGVIDPRVGLGRDSAIGMALVLNLLARESKPLTAIVDQFPQFHLMKEKLAILPERFSAIRDNIERRFNARAVDHSDGLRLEWPDAWLQVRASNTEPIVRIFAESADPERARSLCHEAMQIAGNA